MVNSQGINKITKLKKMKIILTILFFQNVLAEAFEILAAEDEILAPKDASKQKEFNDLIESLPSGSRVDTVQALKSKGIELARAADLR